MCKSLGQKDDEFTEDECQKFILYDIVEVHIISLDSESLI